MDIVDLRALLTAIKAKLLGRPLALCDIGDADGLVSAALFLMRNRNGLVAFTAANRIQRSRVYRLFTWDFVADLPCPGKAVIRADHHETNKPCARQEYYDPEAPCSAQLAAMALGLDNDDKARALVKVAIETDTAKIVSKEAFDIDMLARFSRYSEKARVARMLAEMGLEALNTPLARAIVERGYRARELMLKVANVIGVDKIINVYFDSRLNISYRQLTIELQNRGASMVNILVRLGYRTYRYYCGADRSSGFDCTKVAVALGGGGHSYAAGAQYKAPILRPRDGVVAFIKALKAAFNTDKVNLKVVEGFEDSLRVRQAMY